MDWDDAENALRILKHNIQNLRIHLDENENFILPEEEMKHWQPNEFDNLYYEQLPNLFPHYLSDGPSMSNSAQRFQTEKQQSASVQDNNLHENYNEYIDEILEVIVLDQEVENWNLEHPVALEENLKFVDQHFGQEPNLDRKDIFKSFPKLNFEHEVVEVERDEIKEEQKASKIEQGQVKIDQGPVKIEQEEIKVEQSESNKESDSGTLKASESEIDEKENDDDDNEDSVPESTDSKNRYPISHIVLFDFVHKLLLLAYPKSWEPRDGISAETVQEFEERRARGLGPRTFTPDEKIKQADRHGRKVLKDTGNHLIDSVHDSRVKNGVLENLVEWTHQWKTVDYCTENYPKMTAKFLQIWNKNRAEEEKKLEIENKKREREKMILLDQCDDANEQEILMSKMKISDPREFRLLKRETAKFFANAEKQTSTKTNKKMRK